MLDLTRFSDRKTVISAVVVLCAAGLMVGCSSRTETSKSVSENGQTSATTTVSVNADGQKTGLKLTDYAMRAALGSNPNTAAYVTVHNEGKTPDRLVSVTCACAKTASLHSMSMQGGNMTMQQEPAGFVIAPGQTLTLAPGGNHIMLMDLITRPAEGDTVPVVLTFEKAGTVTLSMPVLNAPLAKAGSSDEHDHMKM